MRSRVHACLECGAGHGRKGEFCSTPCRTGFNNRRKSRGAEFYDLYMAHRFDRDEAKRLGVMTAINRLASIFREEDQKRRTGRRSWRRPSAVLEERPYLKAVSIRIRAGR